MACSGTRRLITGFTVRLVSRSMSSLSTVEISQPVNKCANVSSRILERSATKFCRTFLLSASVFFPEVSVIFLSFDSNNLMYSSESGSFSNKTGGQLCSLKLSVNPSTLVASEPSANLTLIPSVSELSQGSIKTSGELRPQNLNDHSFKPEKSMDFGFPSVLARSGRCSSAESGGVVAGQCWKVVTAQHSTAITARGPVVQTAGIAAAGAATKMVQPF